VTCVSESCCGASGAPFRALDFEETLCSAPRRSHSLAMTPDGASAASAAQYCVFGTVTKGWEVLDKLEQLPTRREGIFVMPQERITYVCIAPPALPHTSPPVYSATLL
jgi:hypothetical protein